MDAEEKQSYIKAGAILKEAQALARKKAKVGTPLLSLAEEIEKCIVEKQGKPAFPVNLSKNNIAAHYTPSIGDESVIEETDVLKIDIGVHVEGYITDAAFTVDFSGKHAALVEAAEFALESALAVAKTGAPLRLLGKAIEDTIEGKGFHPVRNLSGHGLARYQAHSSPSIPNHDSKDSKTLEDGMVVAIEPFASTGKGLIHEAGQAEIFQIDEPKPLRNPHARRMLDYVFENFTTLPFAERWLAAEFPDAFQRKIALRELLLQKCIMPFAPLLEAKDVFISQAEATVLFDGKDAIRLV